MKYFYSILFSIFFCWLVNAQSSNQAGLFFKIDYGPVIPAGDFGQSMDSQDSYASVGHGGSLSMGFHINKFWSLALSVHNSLNKISGVPLFDFNSKENYQFVQINFEPYYKFQTFPPTLYIKPVIGLAARNTPWYLLTVSESSFLDEYIFLGPEKKLGLNYGLGAGAFLGKPKTSRFLFEIIATHTTSKFEVYQGNIITGFRQDVKKSFLSVALKLGLLISN